MKCGYRPYATPILVLPHLIALGEVETPTLDAHFPAWRNERGIIQWNHMPPIAQVIRDDLHRVSGWGWVDYPHMDPHAQQWHRDNGATLGTDNILATCIIGTPGAPGTDFQQTVSHSPKPTVIHGHAGVVYVARGSILHRTPALPPGTHRALLRWTNQDSFTSALARLTTCPVNRYYPVK